MYLDIPLHRCNFCEFVFKTLPVRSKYPAETTNFYRPPEVAVRPKHPKCKNEKRISFSFFVFLISLMKTKNEFVFLHFWKRKTKREFVFRFSFANLKTKNEKTVYTRTWLHSNQFTIYIHNSPVDRLDRRLPRNTPISTHPRTRNAYVMYAECAKLRPLVPISVSFANWTRLNHLSQPS